MDFRGSPRRSACSAQHRGKEEKKEKGRKRWVQFLIIFWKIAIVLLVNDVAFVNATRKGGEKKENARAYRSRHPDPSLMIKTAKERGKEETGGRPCGD